MSSVFHFLPWLQLGETLRIEDLTFDHFNLARWSEHARTSEELETVPRLLKSYRTAGGRAIDRCTVIRQNDKLFTDIDESELRRRKELIGRLCFSALAARELFRQPTWNSSHFIDYAQRFEGEHRFLTILTRRREGSQLAAHPIDLVRFTQPFHTDRSVGPIAIAVLEALSTLSSAVSTDEWRRIGTAIYFFNGANTDSDDVRLIREVLDMFTAFECLCDERNSADRLAHKVTAVLQPREPLLAQHCKRPGLAAKGGTNVDTQGVRFQWMRDFANCRDNVAHGRTDATSIWRHDEHVVLAAIAFPLMVKIRLSELGLYNMTDSDRAQTDAFENMADSDFMMQPSDARHSEDYVWIRLQAQCYRRREVAEFVEAKLARRRVLGANGGEED